MHSRRSPFSGWAIFENALLQHSIFFRSPAQSAPPLVHQQKSLSSPLEPTLRETPQLLKYFGQTPPHLFTCLPTKPLIISPLRISGKCCNMRWVQPQQNLKNMAISIARDCNFRYIPNLLRFRECLSSFLLFFIKGSSSCCQHTPISIAGNTIYLNIYHRLLNSIDTTLSQFLGWISIRSPFLFLKHC